MGYPCRYFRDYPDGFLTDFCSADCSKPITAAASKRPFRMFLYIISLFYCWRCYSAVTILWTGSIGAFRSSAVRFRVLGSRGPGQHPLNQTVPSFGLLRDGCEVPGGRLTLDEAQRAGLLEFPDVVSANGYYFATSEAGPEAADAVLWSVEAIDDNRSTWTGVGASAWLQNSDGTLGLYQHLHYRTPTGRGFRIQVDHRIQWQWVIDSLVSRSIYAMMWFCTGVCGLIGREHKAKSIALTLSSLTATILAVEAIGYHMEGQMFSAASVWIECGPTQIIWIFGILLFETQIIWVLLIFSISILATLILRDTVLFRRPIMIPISTYLTGAGILTLMFVIAVMYFRRRAIRRAKSLTVKDKETYDEVWNTLTGDSVSMLMLRDVQQAAAALNTRCTLPARQLNRLLAYCGSPPSSVNGSSPSFVLGQSTSRLDLMGKLELLTPVHSLDQLFVQATCLEPMLCTKIKVLIT
jgi:hypothetical protein